ncbi:MULTISPECIES: PqqD family protein [Streptomyces]|uniref:PqqD family protein n=2 Tax=Streptomyces TaxID=1883 RepID=A0ABU4K4G4_9ACTN|nr:PqqD family protein [Streptomyces roseolus]MDX2292337.1 PqqD family protein [Streptomyces roseolus]
MTSTGSGALTGNTVPRRKLEARMRKYRGVLVVANAEEAMELDEVAEFIFKKIDGERSLAGIAGILSDTYDIETDEALADIIGMVGEFVEFGVVEADA